MWMEGFNSDLTFITFQNSEFSRMIFEKSWDSKFHENPSRGSRIFNVLLTVHHAMILGNCPTWRTNSFQCIYLFIILYMFRACHAHHQEKQIVSIQLLVNFTVCWWQCRVLVHTTLPPTHSDNYQKLYWYNLFLLMYTVGCDRLWLSWIVQSLWRYIVFASF